MDKAQPTRRAALGILATGPIAMLPALAVMSCSTGADAATVANPALDKAMSAYRSAVAAREAYYRGYVKPACDNHSRAVGTPSETGLFAVVLQQEDRYAEYDAIVQQRTPAIFETPARSLNDLSAKLGIFRMEWSGFDAPHDELEWIYADVARLIEGRQ